MLGRESAKICCRFRSAMADSLIVNTRLSTISIEPNMVSNLNSVKRSSNIQSSSSRRLCSRADN